MKKDTGFGFTARKEPGFQNPQTAQEAINRMTPAHRRKIEERYQPQKENQS